MFATCNKLCRPGVEKRCNACVQVFGVLTCIGSIIMVCTLGIDISVVVADELWTKNEVAADRTQNAKKTLLVSISFAVSKS